MRLVPPRTPGYTAARPRVACAGADEPRCSATARADELTDAEPRGALPALEALVERVRPGWVAFLGLTASWQLPRLAETYGALRVAALGPGLPAAP